jgi:hypothetical protein
MRLRPRAQPRRSLAARLCLLAFVGLGAVSRAAAADPIDLAVAEDRKAVEALAVAFAQARPKTKFERWDPAVRADLVARASKLKLREGALGAVRDVFWKALKANPPGPSGRGVARDATSIATPYGRRRGSRRAGAKAGLARLHGAARVQAMRARPPGSGRCRAAWRCTRRGSSSSTTRGTPCTASGSC